MTNYVVGFLHDGENVALVKKTKPEWQAGKLNGIGGKIEETDETIQHAMTREFKEEAGLQLYHWRHFLVLTSGIHNIHFFTKETMPGVLRRVKTMEEEEIVIRNAKKLNWNKTIPNLEWILPLAMHKQDSYDLIRINEQSVT